MNRHIIKALYKKELTDIFRDKKTIIIMVLIPLVLYPLISFGGLFFSTKLITQTTEKTYNVAVAGANERAYNELNDLLNDSLKTKKYHFIISQLKPTEDGADAVRNKLFDAVIVPSEVEDGFFDYEIIYVSSSNNSSNAYTMIKDVLGENKNSIVESRLREQISDFDELTNPFTITGKDCATKEETAGFLIGMILPYLLIVSVMTGVFYPAIDVSAGERERGTLETLMTLPIKTLEMTIAKFLAVATVADFFMILNILSIGIMGLAAGSSITMFSNVLDDFKISSYIPALIILIIIFTIFVLFTSAVCLCVFFCAKTFKEANNLSSPIMLVFMFASMVSLLPNVELTYGLAWIPVINVSLLVKSVFLLKFDFGLIAIVIVSNIIYTLIVVIIMSQIFSSEDILFGEGIRGVNIFEKRSNMKEKQIPGIGDLILMFAVILLLMLYLSALLTAKLKIWGVGVSQIMIFLVPVLGAWYMKADFKTVFSLKKPRVVELIGSVVMLFGFLVFEQGLMYVCQSIFPSINESNMAISDMLSNSGFIPTLIVAAFLPPIAEETAFRGYLFGTLNNKKISKVFVIIITGIAFGVYHLNLAQGIPAAFMGALMAYMVLNSGSIFTSALAHLINNTIGIVLQYYPEILNKIPGFNDIELTPEKYTILGVVGLFIIGFGFMLSDRKIGFFKIKEQ